MTNERLTFDQYGDFCHKVTAAFKAVRKEGLIARQNFKCCGSCAGYDLATQVEKMPEAKRQKVKGAVFYHRQDTQRMMEEECLFLNFGQIDSQEVGEVGLPTEEVGKIVTRVFKEAGLNVEWDGDKYSRIKVTYPV